MDLLPISRIGPRFLTAAAFVGTLTLGCAKSASGPTTSPAPLATITVAPNPDTLVAFATQLFTATGKDAAGNVVVITPTWSMANGDGTINGSGLFTAGAAAGTSVVQARSSGISGLAAVTVTTATTPPGTLASITVTPNPVALATSATQQFTAAGKDGADNVVAFPPTWSTVNGGGTTTSSGMFTAGSTAGTFSNTVKAASGVISGYASVTVNGNGCPCPVATQLAFVTQPDTTLAGHVISPVVRVAAQDSLGNTVTSFTGPVTVVPGGSWHYDGSIAGTITVSAVNGIASFSDLRIDRPGLGWSLTATAPGFGSAAISQYFAIIGATPRQLAFLMAPPSTVPLGRTFTISVVVQDSVGNTVVTYDGPITLAIGANPGGATALALTASPSVGPGSGGFVPGVAKFDFAGLKVDQAGNGYTLVATADGLTSITSVPFDVTP
jgi:hypothetical protein